MRVARLLALSAVIAAPVAAQSIEESYAKLCSGANKSSESCQVLRKALQEKLAAEDGGTPATAPAPAAPAAPAGSAKPWGFWAALPESGPFYAKGTIVSYRWKEKYRTLDVVDEVSGNASTLALREDGRIDWIAPTTTNQLSEQADGSFILSDGKGTWRVRYSIAEGGLQSSTEYPEKDGSWKPMFTSVMRRLSADELAEARRTLERAASPDQMRANWGLYADLAGRSFVNKSWKLRNVWAYEWVKPGVALSVRYGALMDNTIQGTPTPKAPSIMFDPVAKTLNRDIEIQPGGSVIEPMGGMRTTMRASGSGYEKITEERKNDKWKVAMREQFELAGTADIDATLASLAAPKQGGGSAILSTLAGAVGGAAAGAALGAGTETVLAGAAKGAAIFTENAGAAAALNSAGDSLLGGTPSVGCAAGATARASYPTRPNALAGSSACSMMNEGNYRQVGVEGGKDVQLKTMCAQAHELYAAYKNAIAQGYSEADANRTYAAHQDAARNATSYYANNR